MVLGCPLRKAGDDANHLVQSALQPSAPPSPLPRPIESILKALCVQYLCAVRGKKNTHFDEDPIPPSKEEAWKANTNHCLSALMNLAPV